MYAFTYVCKRVRDEISYPSRASFRFRSQFHLHLIIPHIFTLPSYSTISNVTPHIISAPVSFYFEH